MWTACTIAVPAAIVNALGRPVDRMPPSPLDLFEMLSPDRRR